MGNRFGDPSGEATKTKMNTLSSFHPMQSYRHLCNRLDSNTCERNAILSDIAAEKQRHADKLCDLEAQLPDVIYARRKLMDEGRELLPQLQGFRKCYDNLRAILGK